VYMLEASDGVERLMRFLERLNCEVSIHIAHPESEVPQKSLRSDHFPTLFFCKSCFRPCIMCW
jgi:hypothetical protein